MGWTLGMFVGPILSGILIERLGYYETNCAMGEFLEDVLCGYGLAANVSLSVCMCSLRCRCLLLSEVETKGKARRQPKLLKYIHVVGVMK